MDDMKLNWLTKQIINLNFSINLSLKFCFSEFQTVNLMFMWLNVSQKWDKTCFATVFASFLVTSWKIGNLFVTPPFLTRFPPAASCFWTQTSLATSRRSAEASVCTSGQQQHKRRTQSCTTWSDIRRVSACWRTKTQTRRFHHWNRFSACSFQNKSLFYPLSSSRVGEQHKDFEVSQKNCLWFKKLETKIVNKFGGWK